jgi:UDP-N-acetylmuramate dehydrogenase
MSEILDNVSLLPFNTFHVDVKAKHMTKISSIADLQELRSTPLFNTYPPLILGGGSNVLFTRDFPGLVVKNEIKGITTLDEDDNNITLRVGSGENWHELVMYCVERNLGGIENLSLIPGTVGAAPMQNIGAYGVEVRSVIREVEAVERKSGKVTTFSNEACQFGYRESYFKHEGKDRFFISSVTLTLTKNNHAYNTSYGAIRETLRQMNVEELSVKVISDAVIHIRKSKLPDPAVVGNAGSFFKNPSVPLAHYEELKRVYSSIPGFAEQGNLVKIPAGWMIEQCGWKGKRFQDAGVHPLQALVLVNYSQAKGEEIWDLACNIQSSVYEKFNIKLHPEVNII